MQEGEPEGVAPFPGRGREPAEDGRDSAARITARNARLPGRPAAVEQSTPVAATLASRSGEPVAR